MDFIIENQEALALAVLALAELARRIAHLIPGKRDDEIASQIEAFIRKGVDFLAGRHGKPGDSGLLKPDKD